MSAHSKVGASSAKRWMTCPGSVRMSEGVASPSSAFAAEGTVAHGLGEDALRGHREPEDWLGQVVEQDGHKIKITQEMIDAVRIYVDEVRGELAKGDTLNVEHRFHIKDLHENLFGTNDASIFKAKGKKLIVYDYKHGQGVPVEVEGNPQLLYYAVGALMETGFPAKEVEMVIVQPRCPHPDGSVRRWSVPAFDLMEWAAELVDAVKRTEDPDAPLVPGEHCRWCPGAHKCTKLEQVATETAQQEFGPGLSYDADKLAETLEKLPIIEAWIKNVREFAYAEAEHGRCPPRWKLVAKRATRKWRDEHEAAEALRQYGLEDADLFVQKIKTPPQVEKIVGKANKEVLEALVVAESSGHTLAPESDKRPAVKAAPEDEFSAV